MPRRPLKIFFDGGCRPNPGAMEAAIVIRGTISICDDLGYGTSSDAEWLALIRALELVERLGLAGAVLVGDAAPVIRQANRILSGAAAAPGYAGRFAGLASRLPGVRIRWIRRAQNLAGIALAARHPR